MKIVVNNSEAYGQVTLCFGAGEDEIGTCWAAELSKLQLIKFPLTSHSKEDGLSDLQVRFSAKYVWLETMQKDSNYSAWLVAMLTLCIICSFRLSVKNRVTVSGWISSGICCSECWPGYWTRVCSTCLIPFMLTAQWFPSPAQVPIVSNSHPCWMQPY